jgi:hypothetical protein
MFKIFDWAGNEVKPDKSFKSFEDAWDYIQGEMTDELGLTEEDYQEYHVDNVNVRPTRYLDPNDPRNTTVKE